MYTIAIVGRPNVGKSSLFNKLLGKRKSIVHDQPGVTRDRIYAEIEWVGKTFSVIDTGGITIEKMTLQNQILTQAKIAIEEADVILFITDGIVGLDNDDHQIISMLHKTNKKLILVANKLEDKKEMDYSLYSAGIEKIFPISAIHGDGIGDLLDEAVKNIDLKEKEDNSGIMRLSIIGRPNAGKSSLLNALLNRERSIVSEISGTTRDSVEDSFEIDDEPYKIIDTAGISRKSKLIESVEHFALARAFKSMEYSDLSLLMIDATRELSHFDARVAGYAMDCNKPIIIVINKWDLIKKFTNTMKQFEDKLKKEFKFMTWSPILFISALNGDRLKQLKESVQLVKKNLARIIKTSLLNEVIMEMQMFRPAPSCNGGRLNIGYAKQVNASIPTFLLFVNNKDYAHFSYVRYIENKMREYFDFTGCPIKIILRNKKGGGYE